MKKVFNIILLFFVCIGLTACNKNKNKNLMIYRNFYDQDISTFNYMSSNIYQEITRVANLIDGLVENDKYGNIVPSIAKSWKSEMIDGKQVWTFYLKDNVYWSDYKGNKYDLVTAYDFVTSAKYILNYSNNSNHYNIIASLINNAQNYYNGTLISNYKLNEIVDKISSLQVYDPYNELSFYQHIKDVFDQCNTMNCTTNFSDVGIEAINNLTLKYTLAKPIPYFLSALTNYSFLPANENFINEIGFNNFGTNKKTLLYNGAYLLNDYYHSSRLEYIKNDNYWDKNNVYIDKIILTKTSNYHSANYARLLYENGNISEFSLSIDDKEGWSKYVTGENNTGSMSSPVGNNTYFNAEINNFITYYLIFNQNRVNNNYSTLNNTQISVANKALKNLNFRKALISAINRNDYYGNNLNTPLSSIIPSQFIYNNNIDYNDYFINEYAIKNNIDYETAKNILLNDPFYKPDESYNYLLLALQELNLNDDQLPIKIEYTYFYNEELYHYDKIMIDNWNKILNNCSSDDCVYEKVEIVYNETVDSTYDLIDVYNNSEYNITIIGLYPDFNDPTSYLSAFKGDGELYSHLNHSFTDVVEEKLNLIDAYYMDNQLESRYKACSELEYSLIFEEALLLPLSIKGATSQVIVSDIVPFEKMKSNYGLSPFKFKYRRIANQKYSQQQILELKAEYERGKEND